MENDDTVVKIPDGAVSTSVVMERRDEFNFGFQGSATTGNWNCVIVTNPLLAKTQTAIQWSSLDSPTEDNIWTAYADGIEAPAPAVYPAWTAYTIGGIIMYVSTLSSTTLSPIVIGDQTGNSLTQLVKNVRRTYLGTTTELNAPTLSDQGRVTSGQWNPDIALETKEIKTGTPAVLTDVFDYYVIQVPALTTSSVVQSDEFSREALAKDGSYAPLRPCAPTFELTASTEFRRCDVNYAGEGDGVVDGTEFRDLFLRGWSIQVELWMGLSLQGDLRLKRREGLEIVPAPDSTYGPFATPALPNDTRAKQVLEEFCRTQPHSYVADYNDFGEMIPNLLGGIADVIGGLGLPIISPAVNFAKNLFPKAKPNVEAIADATPLYPRPSERPPGEMDQLVGLLKKLLAK
jgi:hypothetical protein